MRPLSTVLIECIRKQCSVVYLNDVPRLIEIVLFLGSETHSVRDEITKWHGEIVFPVPPFPAPTAYRGVIYLYNMRCEIYPSAYIAVDSLFKVQFNIAQFDFESSLGKFDKTKRTDGLF